MSVCSSSLRFISSPDIPTHSQRGIHRHRTQPHANAIASTGRTATHRQAHLNEKRLSHNNFAALWSLSAIPQPFEQSSARLTERRHHEQKSRATKRRCRPAPGTCWGSRGRGLPANATRKGAEGEAGWVRGAARRTVAYRLLQPAVTPPGRSPLSSCRCGAAPPPVPAQEEEERSAARC